MTKLQAVNLVLRIIGEDAVSALDTGGTSIAGQAEELIDRQSDELQTEGWSFNTELNHKLYVATQDLTVTGTAGFSFEETLTGGTSGATAIFLYKPDSTSVFVANVSGTFQAAETITGGTSGSTATFSSSAALTQSKMAVKSTWLSVDPADRETRKWARRGDFLFQPDRDSRDDEDNGLLFDSDTYADIVENIDWDDLTDATQQVIAYMAAVEFETFKQKDRDLYERALMKLRDARVRFEKENSRMRTTNLLRTPEMHRVKGSRHRWGGWMQ